MLLGEWAARTWDTVTFLLRQQTHRAPVSSRYSDKIHCRPFFLFSSLICMLHVLRISKCLRSIVWCTLALFQLIYSFRWLHIAHLLRTHWVRPRPHPMLCKLVVFGFLRAVFSGSRPQLWWHWLHTLTLPWFSSLLLLFLQTPGWEIVQSCFLLRCWYSECWKRNTVGEGPAELCLGSWQCRVEEEGPSLCPGRCLAMGRSQALFRSQLSYLPTVWPWVDSVSSLNLFSAVCGFALNCSHSPALIPLWGTKMPFVSWHSLTFFALAGVFRFQPEGISFARLSPDHPQRHICSLSPGTLPLSVTSSRATVLQKMLSLCLRLRAL